MSLVDLGFRLEETTFGDLRLDDKFLYTRSPHMGIHFQKKGDDSATSLFGHNVGQTLHGFHSEWNVYKIVEDMHLL